MIPASSFLVFGAAALLMAVTPRPNMIYLISRSICQGRTAGLMSWAGVVLGFTFHMLCASVGLTALFMELEEACRQLEADEVENHKQLAQRDLLPLMMASPFFNRVYSKPLGYAGDYVRLISLIADEATRVYGRALPVNATGAIAAISCELDFTPRMCHGIAVFAP